MCWGNFYFFLSLFSHFMFPPPTSSTHVNHLVCTLMYFSTCSYNPIKHFINAVDLGVSAWQKWVNYMSCSTFCFSHSERTKPCKTQLFFMSSFTAFQRLFYYCCCYFCTSCEWWTNFSPRWVVNYTNTTYWVRSGCWLGMKGTQGQAAIPPWRHQEEALLPLSLLGLSQPSLDSWWPMRPDLLMLSGINFTHKRWWFYRPNTFPNSQHSNLYIRFH